MAEYSFLKDKKAVFFELDDVLFPSKDYLLQVYYLFSQFIEYTEQIDAKEMLAFMQAEYEHEGTVNLFEKTAGKFGLADKYQQNFNLLHQNARLPLKLLLFDKMLQFLKYLVANDIKIFIVTDGNPAEQLNKIKQTEWNELGQHLTVYFTDELALSKSEVFNKVLKDSSLENGSALFVGSKIFDKEQSKLINLPYIASKEIYN